MTKQKLKDLFRQLKLAIAVSGKFQAYGDTFCINGTNDTIDEDTEGINIPGIHYMKSPFPMNPGIKYIFDEELLKSIKSFDMIKGRFDFHTESNQHGIYITADGISPVELTSGKKDCENFDVSFEYLYNKYFVDSDNDVYRFSQEQLNDAKNNIVITAYGGGTMQVRLSKNCFPFMGVLKKVSPANFTSEYTFKPITDEIGLIIIHVTYKACEAIHVYEFTRY